MAMISGLEGADTEAAGASVVGGGGADSAPSPFLLGLLVVAVEMWRWEDYP